MNLAYKCPVNVKKYIRYVNSRKRSLFFTYLTITTVTICFKFFFVKSLIIRSNETYIENCFFIARLPDMT